MDSYKHDPCSNLLNKLYSIETKVIQMYQNYIHFIHPLQVFINGNDDDCPNSLVRQKEGVQGEEEEKAGGRRKAGPTGISTPKGLKTPVYICTP